MGNLLEQQFDRLDLVEQQILSWLANKQEVDFDRLEEEIQLDLSKSKLMQMVESLMRRSFIEKITKDGDFFYTMPSVLRKYVISKYPYVK